MPRCKLLIWPTFESCEPLERERERERERDREIESCCWGSELDECLCIRWWANGGAAVCAEERTKDSTNFSLADSFCTFCTNSQLAFLARFFFWHGLSRKNQLHRPSQKLLASQKIQVKNWMRRVRNYTDPSHPESKLGVRQIDRKQTKPNSETDGQPTMRLEYFFINFERQVHSKTLSIVQVVDMWYVNSQSFWSCRATDCIGLLTALPVFWVLPS